MKGYPKLNNTHVIVWSWNCPDLGRCFLLHDFVYRGALSRSAPCDAWSQPVRSCLSVWQRENTWWRTDSLATSAEEDRQKQAAECVYRRLFLMLARKIHICPRPSPESTVKYLLSPYERRSPVAEQSSSLANTFSSHSLCAVGKQYFKIQQLKINQRYSSHQFMYSKIRQLCLRASQRFNNAATTSAYMKQPWRDHNMLCTINRTAAGTSSQTHCELILASHQGQLIY